MQLYQWEGAGRGRWVGSVISDLKYAFCGNRFNVLEEMYNLELNIVKVLAVSGSFLERAMITYEHDYVALDNRQELIEELLKAEYDVFITNGCPYILPEHVLAIPDKKFINIHPSFLPDLRGADPVPGALLHGRDSGATCHLMNRQIDDGPIIDRIRIPWTDDLDSGLLYQMSFVAEKEVFIKAYNRDFKPSIQNILRESDIYYSYSERDRWIDFSKSSRDILNTIKAFSTRSKGACFRFKEETFTIFDAIPVENPYLLDKRDQYAENQVVFNYEGKLLVKKGARYLKLQQIIGDLHKIQKGDILE